ncbi:MAG: hypothetical protein K2U26_02675 [Cyclobacteriaceae bacterium]|nr:hypothetical protein [Cyclobacteriaceae bacterium]
MVKELEALSSVELELMAKSPLLVCILVAGADGEIDNSELRGSVELALKKKKITKGNLAEFYKLVAEDFEDKLKMVIQSLPIESTQRNPLIFEELAQLNQIFAKIDKSFAGEFYKSLRYIAQHVAESSGGILGIKSIAEEEKKWVELPMIKAPA